MTLTDAFQSAAIILLTLSVILDRWSGEAPV